MADVIYVGLFLDGANQGLLFKKFAPIHEKVFGDHVTLAFRPTKEQVEELTPKLGQRFPLEVIVELGDSRCQAVLVRNNGFPVCQNENPHITISCAPGTKPYYSNTMLSMLQDPKFPEARSAIITLEAVLDFFPRINK